MANLTPAQQAAIDANSATAATKANTASGIAANPAQNILSSIPAIGGGGSGGSSSPTPVTPIPSSSNPSYYTAPRGGVTPPVTPPPSTPTTSATSSVSSGSAPLTQSKTADGTTVYTNSSGQTFLDAGGQTSVQIVNGQVTVNGAPLNSDSQFTQAQANLAPTAPPTEDQFFNDVYSKLQPVIDAINQTEASAETQANIASQQATSAANFSNNAQGMAGSSEATAGAANIAQTRDAAIQQAKAQQATAIGSLTEWAVPQAYTEYTDALTRNDTNSQNYINAQQKQALNTLSGIAATGMSLSDFQSQYPSEYAQILQYYDGDPNAMQAAYISAAPAGTYLNNGAPVSTSGNTQVYLQQVKNPDGTTSIKSVSVELPTTLPPNYKVTSYNQAANGTISYIAFPTDAQGNQTIDPTKPNNGIISGSFGGAQSNSTVGGVTLGIVPAGVTSNEALTGQGIIDGIIPPLTGMGANSTQGIAIKAYLTANGFDATKASLDYTAMTDYISTLNSTQQVRLKQAATAVPPMLTNVQSIFSQLQSDVQGDTTLPTGLQQLNSVNLQAYASGAYGSQIQSDAVNLQQQITDITADLGTIYKGGNSATDLSLQNGASQLMGSWDADTFTSALNLIQQNIAYRVNAINQVGVGGVGGSNPYASSAGVNTGTPVIPTTIAQPSASDISAITSAGGKDNGDGTYTMPDGSIISP